MKNVLSAITLILIVGTAVAQNTLSPVGGNGAGTGGTTSYSVGQIAYQEGTGTGGTTSEGVQQAYEIFEDSIIEGFSEVKITMAVYPNPTTNNVVLNLEHSDFTNLSYVVKDILGAVIDGNKIEHKDTHVAFGHLNSGTYSITILNRVRKIKTYKIIKH